MIHADIAGPFLKSAVGGFEYLLVLVDDHSRFKFAFPLAHRRDAPTKIRQFIASFNRLANRPGSHMQCVGTLHTDGAGEFTSGKFRDELAEVSVHKTESSPEVHSMNGVAERAIKSIFAQVRADLETSGAPRTFWPQAVAHSVDILNRTTCPPHNRCSCYEALTSDKPRIMSIWPWGCRAWAVRPSQQRRKTSLESTGAMGMNLGRSAAQPGAYDLWIPGESRIMTSSEAYFDETLFPWRKAGDQRVSDPVPQPGDADSAQPPTLPLLSTDELISVQPQAGTLAQEFQRVARAANPTSLVPKTMASQFSRKVLVLFSGPYARPDGLIAFLQRQGMSVTPFDNDGDNGGDPADDVLNNDVFERLLRRVQRGEFLAVFAAPPCSTFSISRFTRSDDAADGGPPVIRLRSGGQIMGASNCPPNHRRELRKANELVRRTCAVLRAAVDVGSEICMENPADRGDPQLPHLFLNPEGCGQGQRR